jgi:integrase
MSFDEKQFRRLVSETQKTVVALGTTSEVVLERQRKFTEKLVKHLKTLNTPFERDLCLEWVDGFEHDPASALTSSYVEWIACRRFVILLAEQEAGTLTSWKHYQSRKVEMPVSNDFLDALSQFQAYLRETDLRPSSIERSERTARFLLLYLESQGLSCVSEIRNANIAEYFISPKFDGQKPKTFQTEASDLKHFIRFITEGGRSDQASLIHAIPTYRISSERIVKTLTPEMVSAIMRNKPDSATNKRDKAACLLALHVGLRSGDIRNLKFGDIDLDAGILSVTQQKTGVVLQMPVDNETQNAIIDYILNERRDCVAEYIFVTSVGPAQKLARRQFRIKYRTVDTDLYEKIPQDGLQIFRRTFASRLLQCGTPLSMISEMLGQVSRDAVQRYLSTEEEKMKRCSLNLALIPYAKEDF